MINRLVLETTADIRRTIALSDSENPKDVLDELERASAQGTVVTVHGKAKGLPDNSTIAINPRQVIWWSIVPVDTKPQRAFSV